VGGLADLERFNAYNAIYREYFRLPYSARPTIAAGMRGFLVEIEGMAVRPGRAVAAP
jgi:enamine deaminase RidA (YjgF/YER057c/UK114 family)